MLGPDAVADAGQGMLEALLTDELGIVLDRDLMLTSMGTDSRDAADADHGILEIEHLCVVQLRVSRMLRSARALLMYALLVRS